MEELTATIQRLVVQVQPLAERPEVLAAAGALILGAVLLIYLLWDTLSYAAIPSLDVPLKQEELAEQLDAEKYSPPKTLPKDKIPCYDPGTMQFLGYAKAMTPEEVRRCSAQLLSAKLRTGSQPRQRLLSVDQACSMAYTYWFHHVSVGAGQHCKSQGGLQGRHQLEGRYMPLESSGLLHHAHHVNKCTVPRACGHGARHRAFKCHHAAHPRLWSACPLASMPQLVLAVARGGWARHSSRKQSTALVLA